MIVENKEIATNLILILLVAILLGVFVYGIHIYERDKFLCVANPLGYLQERDNVTISCRVVEKSGYIKGLDLTGINISEIKN